MILTTWARTRKLCIRVTLEVTVLFLPLANLTNVFSWWILYSLLLIIFIFWYIYILYDYFALSPLFHPSPSSAEPLFLLTSASLLSHSLQRLLAMNTMLQQNLWDFSRQPSRWRLEFGEFSQLDSDVTNEDGPLCVMLNLQLSTSSQLDREWY